MGLQTLQIQGNAPTLSELLRAAADGLRIRRLPLQVQPTGLRLQTLQTNAVMWEHFLQASMQQHPGLLLRLQLVELSQLLTDQLVLRLLLLARLSPALALSQLASKRVRLCRQLVHLKGLNRQAACRQQGPKQSPQPCRLPLLTPFLLALERRKTQ